MNQELKKQIAGLKKQFNIKRSEDFEPGTLIDKMQAQKTPRNKGGLPNGLSRLEQVKIMGIM